MTGGLPLAVHRIHIRRTPGIPDPFELGDLCPGVNIVFGPNGSGKTSTLRALEALLWPGHSPGTGLHVAGEYTLEGVRYLAELDAGRRSFQRGGVPCDAPSFPAPELYHRYRLCLEDLLTATGTGSEFAAEIVRQSSGGYDIDKAAGLLGFDTRPSAPRSLVNELSNARESLRDAQQQQQRLHAEALGLAQLEKEAEETRDAASRVREIELALRHARAREELRVAVAGREALPAVLAGLRGDEAERAAQLREQVSEAEGRERNASREFDASETELASSGFDAEPPADLIPSLNAQLEQVRQLHRDVLDADLRVTEAEHKLQALRTQVGSAVTDQQLESMDTSGVRQLAAFARKIEQHSAERKAAAAELRQARDSTPSTGSTEALRRGADLLAQWLRESASTESRGRSRSRPVIVLWVMALLAIAGCVAVALLWQPAVAVLVLLVVGLAVYGSREPLRADTAAMRQRDYERLELQPPASWTPRDVTSALDSLNQQIAEARLAEQRAAWRRTVELRVAELESDGEALDREAAALVKRFGVAPDTDVRLLSWLTERIAAWQEGHSALAGANGVRAKAGEQSAQAMAELVARLAPYCAEAPRTISEAAGAVEALSEALEARRETGRIRDEARRDVERAAEELARLRPQLAALYQDAGIDHGDEAALASLCQRVPAYLEARQAEDSAEGELLRARAQLDQLGERAGDLVDTDVATLDERLIAATATADEVSDRVAAVSALKTRLDQAGRQDEVERSLEAVARAEAGLAAHRDQQLSRVTGGVLVSHLQRATRDRHRPDVFHRARELFSLVTNGRYQLEFQQDDSAVAFRALDNVTARGHSLDELSSGTRVQLLLAVRVAFVETQEQGYRLPLFLDEILGTSDDERARAVIEAVIRLAGTRQVFYFTAQRDEVAKWRSALSASASEHRIVDLAEVRRLQVETDSAWQIDPLPDELLRTIPAPNGHSRSGYRDLLQPPPLRIDAPVGAAHLWYLVSDTSALHSLLSRGIVTWGQCRSLVEGSRVSLLNGHDAAYLSAAARARALEVLCEQAAIGRGRPVDRDVLIRSGAVSDTMLDRVHDAALQCSGSASGLIEALERGDVPRFQSARIEDLASFLRAEGYLDDRPRIPPEQIRRAMVSAVAAEMEAGTLQLADINELMGYAAA